MARSRHVAATGLFDPPRRVAAGETVEQAVRAAARRLDEAGVPTPDVDAELLLGHVLDVSRTALRLERTRRLRRDEQDALASLVERRAAREPLAYVLGEWGFRRLVLKLDRRALVPRPETEVLVERALALVRGVPRPRVLDVGVGSGAIALSIAQEHPGAAVTGVDLSREALALAGENSERTGIAIELREAGLQTAGDGWDLVVSNPPYVAPGELAAAEPEVRHWEPREALVGEGLHEAIARAAQTRWLVLEVGDGQARDVAATLTELGYRDVTVTRDLAGRERVVDGARR